MHARTHRHTIIAAIGIVLTVKLVWSWKAFRLKLVPTILKTDLKKESVCNIFIIETV